MKTNQSNSAVMLRPPKDERIKYDVDYPRDTDFSAFARFLQSKWRVKRGFPKSKLGNFLEVEFAKTKKSNFLTDSIQRLVTAEITKAKKTGGLIKEPRIWNNLLSSQPLCFNLFGELYYNPDLATLYFNELFPDKVGRVTAIRFEYSPGRGNTKYIGDHSAFDVFIEYSKDAKRGFIGIEVKYAESLKEETITKANRNFKEQYALLTDTCELFKPNSVGLLRQPPLSQIWRDHLLSIAAKQDYDDGFFVFLFPSKNQQCQTGVDDYRKYLAGDDERQTGFYPRYLETFVDALTKIFNAEWTKELKERYIGSTE